jgi:hypothetical protein
MDDAHAGTLSEAVRRKKTLVRRNVATMRFVGDARILLGPIRAMDDRDTRADALAWRDGTIIAVGSEAEVRAVAREAKVHEVGDATVLPGFVDAHQHPSVSALYDGGLPLVPPEVTDIESLLRRVRAAASDRPEGEWLVFTRWDENLLAERRPPTRAELDDAAPAHPVFALHYSCHRGVANGRALERASIDEHTPDPSGGAIGRKNGKLDGLLVERGMSRVESLARRALTARDVEGFFARLAEHHRALVAAGITRVVDACVPRELVELYRAAEDRGLLLVPTLMMPVSTEGWLEAPWDALDGPVTGTIEGKLEFGPVKLVFDGAPSCAMCLGWVQSAATTLRAFVMAVRRGSLDPIRNAFSVEPRPGLRIRTGIEIYSRDEAKQVIGAAIERGFAVATHAIGNEAIDHVLDVYEAARGLDRAGAPRIEHASFVSRDLVRRIAGAGIAVVAQPSFLSLPAYDVAPSIPGIRNAALRWFLDAGIAVAGSSDAPVAGFDPLDGIRAAVRRRTASGRVYEPDQRLSLDEALAMYTRTAARVSGAGDRCGTLEAGKRADLVIVDGLGAELERARVRATIIGGDVVFGSLA